MRGAVVATLALLLAACATDRVTLLESATGGKTGAVAVLQDEGEETVLDQANSQALLRGRTPRVRNLDGVSEEHAALMAMLPPTATTISLNFPTGDARILANQRTVIDQIQRELARRPGAQIEVAGFTDSVDDDAHNDALSKRRAEAVAEELREFGFEIDAEDVVGRGEDDAKRELGDNVESEAFRRVDVIIR